MRNSTSVLFGLLLVFILQSCTKKKEYIHNQGFIFGTVYNITYEHNGDLADDINKLLNEFDMSMSTYKENSVISKINRNKSYVTDGYFRAVFRRASQITDETEGAFDITVAPLVNAWGFGFSKQDSITPEIIDSVLQYVGMDLVSLEEERVVKKHPNVMLDASAIAKGYAVDIVAYFLDDNGVRNYMIEIGGEMRLKGHNPKNKKWHIGIDKPVDDPEVRDRQLQEVIAVTDIALATSGNYRNFYLRDGKKYAHTISPFTGYPVGHKLLGVSVLAPDCMTADAYATAFMVLGFEKSMKIIESHKELEAYFILSGENNEYEVFSTKGFSSLIVDNGP